MDEKIDPIVAFVRKHRMGYVQLRKLKDGTFARVWFYYEDQKQKRKYFGHNLREEDIKTYIVRTYETILYRNSGMGDILADRRKRESKTTITDLVKWFIEISLIERIPTKHEFKEYKTESAKSTMVAYEYAAGKIRSFLKDTEGNENFYVENFTTEHLNRFKRWLIKAGLSTNLSNNILRSFRAMLRKARIENKFNLNIFDDFEFIKEHKGRVSRSILTPKEMKLIAECDYVVSRPELWITWQILRFTGIRAADFFRMTRKWIDLKKQEYSIYVAKRGGMILTRPYHKDLQKYLVQYFAKHKLKPDDRIIAKHDNKFGQMFRYSIERLYPDLKGIGTHSPRHWLGSYLRNSSDFDHDWIGFMLGHTGKDVTAVYTHEKLEKLREMLNKLPLDGGEIE